MDQIDILVCLYTKIYLNVRSFLSKHYDDIGAAILLKTFVINLLVIDIELKSY